MFNVVVEHRKRRVWTPRTVAVSVGAHLVVLGAVVAAAANAEPAPPPVVSIEIGEFRPKPPPQPVKPPARPRYLSVAASKKSRPRWTRSR